MSSTIVATARGIAYAAHFGQQDKIGLPYIEHVARVVAGAGAGVLADGFYEGSRSVWEVETVAWLHDVVEDTDLTLRFLELVGMPATVVAAVDAITHRKSEPRDSYYVRVRSNWLAHRVKLADVADNSAPWRLMQVPLKDRERLAAKYRHAHESLTRGVSA